MPETVETEEIHFFDGLLRRPVIVRHAIGGDENAGAIVAEPAMNENFFVFIFEQRKKFRDLIVGGRRPPADGNVDKVHAGRFGLLAFPFDLVGIFAAKVDDGGDAQFLQLFEASRQRLCAAEKGIVDFSGVGEAGELEFFAVRERRDGRRRNILRCQSKRKDGEEGETKKRAGAERFHRILDAKSLARGGGKKKIENALVAREEKAPLDIDAVRKSHPHLAFFS